MMFEFHNAFECLRCGVDLPADQEEDTFSEPDTRGVIRHCSGAMLVPNGGGYCATCAPNVMFCRVCGCTDEQSCVDGCYWTEPGLCSSCD
jgi:hypothetical protein